MAEHGLHDQNHLILGRNPIMAWEIDRFHSLVEFSVQHLKVATVRGRFTEVQGTIELDPQNPERSWVKAQIITNSIHTGAPQRDVHLRTADFFEIAKYPTIGFESTQVKHIDKNRFIVGGNLSLHGIKRPVQLRAIYTGISQDMLTEAWRVGLRANTVIDRRNFGMTFNQNKAGVILVGYEIYIDIIIEAVMVG
jgi:polyisoprenoid-binding protein YceI